MLIFTCIWRLANVHFGPCIHLFQKDLNNCIELLFFTILCKPFKVVLPFLIPSSPFMLLPENTKLMPSDGVNVRRVQALFSLLSAFLRRVRTLLLCYQRFFQPSTEEVINESPAHFLVFLLMPFILASPTNFISVCAFMLS